MVGTISICDIIRCVLLIEQGLYKALKDVDNLSKGVDEQEKEDLMEWTHNVIQIYLYDEVLKEVVEETIAVELWTKLETLYMIESLTNRLYLKHKLYTLQIKKGVLVKYKDQTLILLCSLLLSYDHFIDTLLYGRDNISSKDVQVFLNSRELKSKC